MARRPWQSGVAPGVSSRAPALWAAPPAAPSSVSSAALASACTASDASSELHAHAARLDSFHAELRQRATAHGFSMTADVATGRISFQRGLRAWRFRDGASAAHFMDGYEFGAGRQA